MAGPQVRNDREDVIELEPTIEFQSAGSAPSYLGIGPSPTLAVESPHLLRSRLRVAALFLGVPTLIFLFFRLVMADEVSGVVVPALAVRLALCAALAGLLFSRVDLNVSQLRTLEYVFFGLLTLTLMITQYLVERALMTRAEDLPILIAYQKNGVIYLFVLMVVYGTLVPNDPRRSAMVICLMALAPFVLLAIEVEGLAEDSTREHLISERIAMANALFVLIGAGLSIASAYVLHGLRSELKEARKLGQYHLGEKLGEGGMGAVFMAEHELLKRPCALKMIRPEVNTNPIAQARFEREVKSAAMLTHPNSLEIYDYGRTDDGTFYYVMQYLPGLSSADLVAQFGQMTPGRAVYLARQAALALHEAHQLGLVHRDLKPANIFVAILGGACDVVKVLDFGLVKVADPNAPQLTADYTVSGTPQFMSPEQATGADSVDGRADIYALGAVLYYFVTGKPPFEGTTAMDLMIAHARDPVVPPRGLRADVPADLEAVILRCLAKKPEERYRDARSLAQALAACECSRDWDEVRAEAWWAEQAETQIAAAAAESNQVS